MELLGRHERLNLTRQILVDINRSVDLCDVETGIQQLRLRSFAQHMNNRNQATESHLASFLDAHCERSVSGNRSRHIFDLRCCGFNLGSNCFDLWFNGEELADCRCEEMRQTLKHNQLLVPLG